jgi:hypothetical protein
MNRRRVLSILSLAAVAMLVGCRLFAKGDSNLVRTAHFIGDISSSSDISYHMIIGSLNEDTLLACHRRNGLYGRYHEIDTRSGAMTLLPDLDAALANEDHAEPATLSPDRQWLLLDCPHNANKSTYHVAVRLADSHVQYLKWKGEPYTSYAAWSSDSKSGMVLDFNGFRVSNWSLADPALRAVYSPHVITNPPHSETDLVGPVADGVLLYQYTEDYSTEQCITTIQFICIESGGDQKVIGTVKIPHQGSCSTVEISPDGRRLVWLMSYYIREPESPILRMLSGWLHRKTGSFESLWTSNLDGSNLHEIGSVEMDFSQSLRSISQAGWMQDGKRLWFSDEKALWTVPAN